MKTFRKNFAAILLTFMCAIPYAFGGELTGTASVNQSSDTAANAKTKAINLARRQILYDVLSQYSQRENLSDVLKKSSNDELMNLILSTSVSNEQISSNAYSANVTMNLDNEAVKRWLTDNGVQNWVPTAYSDEKFSVFIVAKNGIADWAELKRIARNDNIEIETQHMAGNQILVKMPANYRSKFTANIRGAGWKYTDNDGILQIWK